MPYFPKHPVHRCFIVRSRHEHAGEAENLVLCGLVHRLVLRFPAAAQQHEDTAAPPGPRRYDVAYSLSKLRYVFFSVKGMLFIGCFIGLLAPAVVFLVQKGGQMAAQLFIPREPQGFAISLIVVAADDFRYTSILSQRCVQQGIGKRQGIEEGFPVQPAVHLIPVSVVTIPHHTHSLP